MTETRLRSLFKAISWRVFATTLTGTLVFLFTHKAVLAIGVGLLDSALKILAYFLHERLVYKPSDGLAGVVQRYVFQFLEDFSVKGEEVFSRHHVPESRWQSSGAVEANFQGIEDEIVLCEGTQFSLVSFRPALKRLGLLHGDEQVHGVKVGNSMPYAVLSFSRQTD